MMSLLDDKVCIVTGCNKGIGRAIVSRFIEEGAIVYGVARSEGTLEDIQCESGKSFVPFYSDIREKGRIRELFQQIKDEHGALDVLVNNAGVMRDSRLEMVTDDILDETFSINVFAGINMMQMAMKLMKRKKKGSIINISSIVGVCGNAGQVAYSASKGAVISMTKSAAKELAVNGIRVNAIAPGIIDTSLHVSVSEEKMAERLAAVPMGRMGTPDEVANTCVFLASNLSEYISGQIIGVDGAEIL